MYGKVVDGQPGGCTADDIGFHQDAEWDGNLNNKRVGLSWYEEMRRGEGRDSDCPVIMHKSKKAPVLAAGPESWPRDFEVHRTGSPVKAEQ